MKCRLARATWRDAVDGPLDPARSAQLEAHLARCKSCRAFVAQMHALDAGLDALRDESEDVAATRFARTGTPSAPAAPPPSAALHIRPALDGSRERTAVRPAFRRAAGFAIAAAILMAAGIALYTARRAGPDAPGVAAGPSPGQPAPHVARGGPQRGESLPGEAPRVVLTGASADEFLIISEESRHPGVHIYRLHAIYRMPDDGAAIEPALAAAGSEPHETGS